MYFNNFFNSFRYLYYFTCAHIYPHFPGPSSLACNRRTYIFSWLVTTHFYILSFNIIIIVFVDKISPKSNSLIAFIMCWPSSHLVVRRLRRTYIIYHPWSIQIISCFYLAVTRVDHRVRTLLQNRQYTCKYPLIYCVNYNIHTRYNLCIRYIYYTVQCAAVQVVRDATTKSGTSQIFIELSLRTNIFFYFYRKLCISPNLFHTIFIIDLYDVISSRNRFSTKLILQYYTIHTPCQFSFTQFLWDTNYQH